MKLTRNAGAKVVIHEAGNPPLPDEKGIDLQPNTETSVAIQKADQFAKPHKIGNVLYNIFLFSEYHYTDALSVYVQLRR